jgi:hypothetical protein
LIFLQSVVTLKDSSPAAPDWLEQEIQKGLVSPDLPGGPGFGRDLRTELHGECKNGARRGWNISSRRARLDLKSHWRYIARDNLPAAYRLLEATEATFKLIAATPELGSPCGYCKLGRPPKRNHAIKTWAIENGPRIACI